MPLPATINDLSTTAASNSPPGTEAPTTFDDYLRVYASYIAALRDVALSGTASLSTLNITYSGTLTGSTGIINIGTAQFYKDASGNVGINTATPSASGKFAVADTNGTLAYKATTSGFGDLVYIGGPGNSLRIGPSGFASGGVSLMFTTAGSVRTDGVRLDSSGNVIFAAMPSTPPALANNGEMTLNPTSNTNVRISLRGSDGVTRTGNITLS